MGTTDWAKDKYSGYQNAGLRDINGCEINTCSGPMPGRRGRK